VTRIRRLAVILLLYCHAASTPASPDIPSFEASYRIERARFEVGRIRLDFHTFPNGRYLYKSITEIAGFIAWFRDERVEESSRGFMDAAGIHVEHYRFLRTGGRRDKRVEVRFDPAQGSVTNTVDGQPWEMQIPEATLDKLVVQIAMMQKLQERVEDQQFRVADGGSVKDFRIHVIGQETIEVPAGRFATIKVQKNPKPGGRQTFLWLAPGLGYLPVQIMRTEEDGATYYSQLESVSDSLRIE